MMIKNMKAVVMMQRVLMKVPHTGVVSTEHKQFGPQTNVHP